MDERMSFRLSSEVSLSAIIMDMGRAIKVFLLYLRSKTSLLEWRP